VTITPFDDYPVHQTPQPIAHPVSGDPNHYDRYWFNGFSVDAEWFFGIALGVYPNRGIIDGAFSFVKDGAQQSVFGSGRAPADRSQTAVGPISIEVVQPLSTNVVRVKAAHLGLEAELTWRPRTIALEEPRTTFVDGTKTTLDSTRFTQWGVWEGWVDAAGERTEVKAAATRGTKDRSWGIRGVGDQPTTAPSTRMPGVFFSWAPTHFDDRCTHVMLFDNPDGTHSHISACTVPVIGEGAPTYGDESGVERADRLTANYTWRPGTRRVKQAVFDFDYGTRTEQLSYEPLLDFQMKGIGYFHPEWGHGRWHGESAEGSDSWRIEDLDLLNFTNIHIQSLCKVTSSDGRSGIGSLEQLAIGPHASGLTGLLDGAA
jgi:hypothetical protein